MKMLIKMAIAGNKKLYIPFSNQWVSWFCCKSWDLNWEIRGLRYHILRLTSSTKNFFTTKLIPKITKRDMRDTYLLEWLKIT